MKLVLHGGGCCGVKTLYGFGSLPTTVYPAMPEVTDEMVIKYAPLHNKTINRAARPKETALERFKAALAVYDNRYAHGILEVTLAVGMYSKQENWMPILLEHGFTLSTECYNSNSRNRVFVFHRIRDNADGWQPDEETEVGAARVALINQARASKGVK